MGADPETFLGLAGTGDLWLTCTGDLSRNRRVGLALGRGESLADIVSSMSEVAEGIRTTEAACELGRRHGVELPIAALVDEVIRGKITPEESARQLMARQLRNENE
jgi:glycerol-3-phosphate dehydrogenase (NAD(P)+)